MITIRNFTSEDADFICQNWATNPNWDGCKFEKDIESIKNLILLWNKKLHKSRYFEQFVIIYDNKPVGMVSLYEQKINEVSVGIYIEQESRRKGIATKTYNLVANVAKSKGYSYLSAGVLEDNIPSINLHLKNGFVNISSSINKNGEKQIRFIKEL